MPHLTEEDLMAWADDELDAEAAARVEAVLQEDSSLRERGLAMRQLRQRLHAAFADELAEPAPDRLMRAAMGIPSSANAGPLPTRPSASNWARWGGLAAGILVVAGAASMFRSDKLLAVEPDGRIVAHGVLAKTLDHGLASEAQPADVHVHLTFREVSGKYCRVFSAPVGSGLACHDAGHWQVVTLSAPPERREPAGEMRLAGSEMPQVVLQEAQRRIAGPALDERQEREARDQAWQR